MDIINSNFRCAISTPYEDIAELEPFLPNCIMYNKKPVMLKFRFEECITILIFTSQKIRLMGKPPNHFKAIQYILRTIPQAKLIQPLKLMSHSVRFKLPFTVDLKLLNQKQYEYYFELFPAAGKKMKRIHMNIFHSGTLILTGVQKLYHAKRMITNLINEISTKEACKQNAELLCC
jgi:hypothetical protein